MPNQAFNVAGPGPASGPILARAPLTAGLRVGDDKSKTLCYNNRREKHAIPTKPRNTDTITFSLPPEMAQQLRQVVKEEDRTVSELLREAIRLYMEEREWRRRERLERLRSRRTGQSETQGGETDE